MYWPLRLEGFTMNSGGCEQPVVPHSTTPMVVDAEACSPPSTVGENRYTSKRSVRLRPRIGGRGRAPRRSSLTTSVRHRAEARVDETRLFVIAWYGLMVATRAGALAARLAHNPKVADQSPAPAAAYKRPCPRTWPVYFCEFALSRSIYVACSNYGRVDLAAPDHWNLQASAEIPGST